MIEKIVLTISIGELDFIKEAIGAEITRMIKQKDNKGYNEEYLDSLYDILVSVVNNITIKEGKHKRVYLSLIDANKLYRILRNHNYFHYYTDYDSFDIMKNLKKKIRDADKANNWETADIVYKPENTMVGRRV